MNILLGVTGSISAYKAYDLVREWTKSGDHQLRVILTKGALELI
ncbi:MAG: phosphopantothenoylcysteine decarboxylase, partial [Oligoflexia bacterium]|nr:phosphopantothenoylcysteine decarboxylase [Oligoflexia bacterium]